MVWILVFFPKKKTIYSNRDWIRNYQCQTVCSFAKIKAGLFGTPSWATSTCCVVRLTRTIRAATTNCFVRQKRASCNGWEVTASSYEPLFKIDRKKEKLDFRLFYYYYTTKIYNKNKNYLALSDPCDLECWRRLRERWRAIIPLELRWTLFFCCLSTRKN